MLNTIDNHPASVSNVLQQHVEDAAFYWISRQDGLWKPAFKIHDVMHLDRLLDAHLEGALCGGQSAIELALERMQQWETADEAFISTYLLAHHQNNILLQLFESLLDHDSTKGAAAALLWCNNAYGQALAERWWQSDSPPLHQAAIPYLLSLQDASNGWITAAANDSYPAIRARGYRTIGEYGLNRYIPLLISSLSDTDTLCRFEAANALCLLGEQDVDLFIIRDAIAELEGFTQRRALLIWAMLSTKAEFNVWITTQTDHRAILWAIAFQGNCDHLSQLGALLKEDIEAKLTGYVISHLTGLDIYNETYSIPPTALKTSEDDSVENENIEDDGLPVPDTIKVLKWIEQNRHSFKPDNQYLNGKFIGRNAKEIYQTGWQPQRWQAAIYLSCQKDNLKTPPMRQPFYT